VRGIIGFSESKELKLRIAGNEGFIIAVNGII